MDRTVDIALGEIKSKLLAMGGLVERAIALAVDSLVAESTTSAKQVFEIEKKINQAQVEVDDFCVRLLALHQPMATDLRFIIATIKVNCDLERMGDQAVNIAKNTKHYFSGTPHELMPEIREMCDAVRWMVTAALDAFVSRDLQRADDIRHIDDNVDQLKSLIFTKAGSEMKANPNFVDQGLSLILIARNLEKIGDHASNIAEDVIYMVQAEVVRHHPERLKNGK